MHLADYITIDRILPQMRSVKKKDALHELASLVVGPEDKSHHEAVLKVLAARERLASTAIGDEIAIPHGKLNAVGSLVLALARSREGLDFESVDGKPTRIFFVLVAPENSTGVHLKALARISRLCKDPDFRNRILEAADSAEMYEILRSEDSKFYAR